MVYCQSFQINVSHSLEALSIKKENKFTNHKKLSSTFLQKQIRSEFNVREREHPNYSLDFLKVL